MNARLTARYRRLVRAYPPGRRRDELLDTLVEAAPAGRTRPTLRETGNLVRHGMRARLGRPASAGVVVIAVLAALSAGYLGAVLACAAAWQTVPDYPGGSALAAITGTVFPGLPVESGRSADGLLTNPVELSTTDILLNGPDEDFEYVTLSVIPTEQSVPGDYRAWSDGVRGRLAAAGWHIEEVRATGATSIETGEIDESGRNIWATRDGLSLEFEAETTVSGIPPGSFYAEATLARFPPWYVTTLGWLGWLAGVLAGWLLTGWVSRRSEQSGGIIGALTRELVVVALLVLTPLTILGTLLFVVEQLRVIAPYRPFWYLSATYGYPPGMAAAALCLLSVIAAALARRPVTAPEGIPS